MLHQLMEFYVAFQVCCYLLGLTKSISMLLQGSNMERCCAYEMVTNAQAAYEDVQIILRMSFIIFTQRQVALQKGHSAKSVGIRSYSGPYFPAFGLNTERYFVSLRIQSEWRKIRTRKSSVFGQFSCSVVLHYI